MSAATHPASAARLRPAAEAMLLAALGFQLALIAPTAFAFHLDVRSIDGASIWAKPLKFQLSLALTMLTVLVYLPSLSVVQLASRTVRWSAAAVAIASTLEIAYITLQAARGVRSHFNTGPVESIAYALMGVGAVSIVAGCFVIGACLLKAPSAPRTEGWRLGGATGLMLGAVLTLVTAGIMSSGFDGPGHWVGGVRSDAGGLPLVGWSTTGGDLRVPHFFATHLMQGLPLLGWLADRAGPRAAGPVVAIGAILGLVVVALTFVQAIAGRPFWG